MVYLYIDSGRSTMSHLKQIPPVKTAVHQRATPMLLHSQRAREAQEAMRVDPLLPLSAVVEMLGNPSYSLLRRWIADGELRVWRATNGRGHFRVRLSEIERFRAAGEKAPDAPK
jgi:hypothetical protein